MKCMIIKQAWIKQHSSYLKHLTHYDQEHLLFNSEYPNSHCGAQYYLAATLTAWAMEQSAPSTLQVCKDYKTSSESS